ncbi:MAG: BspA family leucine-rich repeat surface protein [Clostridia bacterium]|nr:BspA family leucine-rich repeat surface protein [Clostridia bacterium]
MKKEGAQPQPLFHNDFSNNFDFDILTVSVNGVNCPNKKSCTLDDGDNNIILQFSEKLTECEKMFHTIKTIKEVDLSNFDASEVVSFDSMFYDCTQITRITFGDIDTSSLIDMDRTFQACRSLKSIDLSHFTLSEVKRIDYLFEACEILEDIKF